MAKRPKFYVLGVNDFLPAQDSDAVLGALVPYYTDPKDSIKALPNLTIRQEDYEILSDYEVTGGATNGFDMGFGLKDLAEVGAERSRSTKLTITSETLKYRRLLDYDEHLKRLLADPDYNAAVKPWIRTVRKSKTACLIIGLLICDAGQVIEISDRVRAIRAGATIPVVEATTGGGGVSLSAAPGDPNVHLSVTRTRDTRREGTLPGPRIIGLEYRWVTKPMRKPPVVHRTGPVTDHQLGDESDEDQEEEELDANTSDEEEQAMDDATGESPVLMDVDWEKLVTAKTMR